ncbi:MAG: hypothetical protein RR037_04355 [Alistipes sp.]
MNTFKEALITGADFPVATLDQLIEQQEWFSLARLLRARATGEYDNRLKIIASGRGISLKTLRTLNPEALTQLTDEDRIERFLQEKNLRIVIHEEATETDVTTEVQLNEEDDIVSEELAEVYVAQGLLKEATAIYRQLSLQNPEKSVYFAEIIRRLETNN